MTGREPVDPDQHDTYVGVAFILGALLGLVVGLVLGLVIA